MHAPDYALLLDPPAFPAERYAALADRLAALMSTSNDVLLIQAEAVLALEAAATSLARPGLKALNIVTSPYGTWFGGWLEKGGATVRNLTASQARPVTLEEVERALDEGPDFDLLAIVHAESASGILNPLPAIAALARERGIVTLVDAVASIGGHAFDVDRLGIDIAVIGPQKALAGPAGISAISVSERAWTLLSHDGAPDNSMLSLMDQKNSGSIPAAAHCPERPPRWNFTRWRPPSTGSSQKGWHPPIDATKRRRRLPETASWRLAFQPGWKRRTLPPSFPRRSCLIPSKPGHSSRLCRRSKARTFPVASGPARNG